MIAFILGAIDVTALLALAAVSTAQAVIAAFRPLAQWSSPPPVRLAVVEAETEPMPRAASR